MTFRESPLDGMTVAEYDAYQDELVATFASDDDRLPLIRRMRRQGNTLRMIGRTLGITKQAVHQMLKKPLDNPPASE